MIVSEEVYLEHHGVKGMKWGVVKQKSRDRRAKATQKSADRYKTIARTNPNPINARAARKSQAKADRAKRWAKGKQTRADKTHRAVNAAFVVGLGAIVVKSAMSNHGKTPISKLPKQPVSGVEAKIREAHAVKLSSLTRMHAEGKMDAGQFKSFSESLAARYERKVAEALSG